jgi:ribonuclease HI
MDEAQLQATHAAFGPLCTDQSRCNFLAECKKSNKTGEIASLIEALLYLESLAHAKNVEFIIPYHSKHAGNVATGDWFPKTNYKLILTLKKVYTVVSGHKKIQLQWVKGHAKVLGNELAEHSRQLHR